MPPHCDTMNGPVVRAAKQALTAGDVRLHRAGQGEPHTGLKPAGLDEGPVIPRAETAMEEDDTSALIAFLTGAAEEEIGKRMNKARAARACDPHDVVGARKYVQATLDLMVHASKLHEFIRHGEGGEEPAY